MHAPQFSHQTVLAALREHYGLDGMLTALLGESDQNLQLTAGDGRKYVTKIAPAGESRAEVDFQVAALRHLERRDIELGLPRVVPTLGGEYSARIGSNPLRVFTWVDGEMLRRDALTPAVAASLGHSLAALGRALRDFDHAGKARELQWDLQRALNLRQRTSLIGDAGIRAEVVSVFDEFEDSGLARFLGMRRQVIHNDANPENVLFDSRKQVVTGIIDFADMVDAPLIADVAIAGSYLRDVQDPLRLLAPFVAAYHEAMPLVAEELELLQLLLRVRLATTLTMAHWRMAELGNEDPYLKASMHELGDAERFLRRLGAVDGRELANGLLSR